MKTPAELAAIAGDVASQLVGLDPDELERVLAVVRVLGPARIIPTAGAPIPTGIVRATGGTALYQGPAFSNCCAGGAVGQTFEMVLGAGYVGGV